MAYSAAIIIANRTDGDLTVFVEPNVETVRLPAGGKLRVVAEAERPGEFEVDHTGEYMAVTAWPSAVARCELDRPPAEADRSLPGERLPERAAGQRRPPFVSLILVGDNQVTVNAGPDADARALRALGGRRHFFSRGTWTFPARDDQALAALLEGLRDVGVAFAWEPGGWPPAAVFAHLRDRGLVQGPITAIALRAAGDFQLFEM